MTNYDILIEVSKLIDAWCDRRELKALAGLLPAWTANNGLTDGWADVLDALETVRASVQLPDDERAVLNQAIVAVERIVYRS